MSVTERHTFLFTDLVGFTALTELDGDDRGAEVAVAFALAVRALAAEHRAEVVKTLGDGVMLRCDDPGAAVRLGVRIVDELARQPGLPPVRVGVHAGPAVARDGDWYGMTVNVAARLCSAAGGDEVLVSEATVLAAGRMRDIEVEEARLHWLKNVTEPVAAHPVRAARCRAAGRLEGLKARPRARRLIEAMP